MRLRLFQTAVEKFTAAQSRSGKSLFSDMLNKAQRNLAEVEKDNDFIYHERVPDYRSLEPIGKAPLAKSLPLAEKMSQNFTGIQARFLTFGLILTSS